VTAPLVLKLGGELLESADQRARIGAFAAGLAGRPLVVVHGGGRAIDEALTRQQIAPHKVEGLRVTDAATLDVVVAVLAGSSNTALVAALVAAGVRAVGLTGVDAGLGRARRVSAHRTTTGAVVDLGFVGDPVAADGSLAHLLVTNGYVPVIASIGLDEAAPGTLLNVNADVMACRIAAAWPGSELIIAGGTAGVLDAQGRTIGQLDTAGIDRLIASGTATAGMVAKLASCREALGAGVSRVRIVDGRGLAAGQAIDRLPGTELTDGVRDLQVRPV
jgi:acetylglutamate kinase